MANVKIILDYPIIDGQGLTFKAPCACTAVSGLIVYYPEKKGAETLVSKVFTFKDSHCNDLGDLDNLFSKNAYVKVLLDIGNSAAYVQNADTNAYLEGRIDAKENKAVFTKFTLMAGGWGGNTYDLESQYPSATYDIEIFPASTATAEQAEAYGNAMLASNLDANIVTALGTVPTVNIPVIVKAVKK